MVARRSNQKTQITQSVKINRLGAKKAVNDTDNDIDTETHTGKGYRGNHFQNICGHSSGQSYGMSIGQSHGQIQKQEEIGMDNKKSVFCKVYAAGFSAEAAVWEAGYLRDEAKAIADQLLSSDEVQTVIEQEKAEAKKLFDEVENTVKELLAKDEVSH